jgi:tetratricopeptide (TPR) repeat protein
MLSQDSTYSLSEADKAELQKLVSVLEISSGTTIILAIAPESNPQHIVVENLKECLATTEENFDYYNFFYSDNSLHNFLYDFDENQRSNIKADQRQVVMTFGIDTLPPPRLVKEMQRLNLGREELFERNLVFIFWMNKISFLDEFRQRAPDFWDWREKVVQFETRNPLLYPYLEWLIAENSYLKMSGVMQVNRQVDIFLDQIYVSLQAQWRQEIIDTSEGSQREIVTISVRGYGDSSRFKGMDSSLDDWDEPCYYEPLRNESISISNTTKTVTQKVDLSQAVQENSCSIILGAPGAGKTTLLRYLALHFATAKRDNHEKVIVDDEDENKNEKKKELGKPLLPIFFRIADYAEKLKQLPDLTLLEYLRQFYRQWEANFQTPIPAQVEMGTEVVGLLLDMMRQGECLVLLDGLDEVFDQESRKQIVERINKFVDEFSSNKFVITSRIAGYRDVQLSSRFAEFTIEDMDTEQVERFLYRWCRTVEKAQQPDTAEEQWQKRGDEQAQEILKAIKDNPGVQRLTANPLLLTILALIHRNGERLPNRRVKLYELAVQTLTEDWQLSKKLPDAPRVVLKESEVVELLAPLAYWMHKEKPSGLVTQAEVEEKLAAKLAELNDAEPESDSVRQAVEEFLRKVRETTGLFVERTPGVYGFMHLTFEEYFTARYIADNDQSEILQLIQQHIYEPRWNEPLLLALGYYGTHFPTQVKKLVEKMFKNLEDYEPVLQYGEIKIKNSSSDETTLLYLKPGDESANNLREVEFNLKDLLFAGQVIAEVEVNNTIIRKKLIRKLVLTCIGLDSEGEFDTIKQLLRLLRKIEIFYQKDEVINLLQEASNDLNLSEEIRIQTKTAIIYVTCGETTRLVDCVTKIINELEPLLLCSIGYLFQELGDEMTPALEASREYHSRDEGCKRALTFLTAMSYMREDKYDKAINTFEKINDESDISLRPFICWALAKCYEEKEDYDKSNGYYKESKLTDYHQQNSLYNFWEDWGWCQRLNKKYEQSFYYYQKALAVTKKLHNFQYEAITLCNIGRVYQDWDKHEQSIDYYRQSRELYQQLGQDKDVANQWYNLAICYRLLGKYKEALDCQSQYLVILQQLDDQVNIADAYFQLGQIYQKWGKYKEAVNYYEQSCELYQQLELDEDIANRWYNLAVCYRLWGKYEQALDCVNQDLAIRQQLNDQVNIALANSQLGQIYQDWGKYGQAINYHQQSRELYQQLERDEDIANRWYNLAVCYRLWGKYEQALDCVNQDLAIRQQLNDQVNIARAYFQLAWIYQDRGKYEQAINYLQTSRELYQQLGQDKDVANQWYKLANCYRLWGKYEQAIHCEKQGLAICQQLDDQINIALANSQLGRIYQNWDKYGQAINYHQQSRELYQQLGREYNVANQWNWLAFCYLKWGKYEQALECINQYLAIRQHLDDQANIAQDYFQIGFIYQEWGKYEQAVNYYKQSQKFYQQLGREHNVANHYKLLAFCYLKWGKYEQALEFQNQDLAIRQQLDDQVNIARAYFKLAWIYQDWGKYEQAVNYYEQSRELYQQLGREQDVANQFSWLASCYLDLKDYTTAISYYQQSIALHQKLAQDESISRSYRQLAYCKYLFAKNTPNLTEASDLLAQAEQKIRQAIEINTAGEYKEKLAYDHAILSLIYSEHLRILPKDNSSIQEKVSLFEEYYNTGLSYLDELGKTVDKAEEALDIARAYLEIKVIENLDRSEEISQECLKTFQEYNRQKLEASAHKLLGEIYLKRSEKNQPGAKETATQFLAKSLQIYQNLDLQEKAVEVEQLINTNRS